MPAWLLPAAILASGVASSLFKNKAEKDRAQEASRLYNDWLARRDTAVDDIFSNLTARGYDPYGPQTVTNVGSSSGGSDMFSTTRSRSMPVVAPEFQPLVGLQRGLLEKRLSSPSSLPAGYAQRAVAGIQAAAAPGRQAESNLAARRGLNRDVLSIGSPVERQARGQIADLIASLPLQERSLQNEDLGLALQLSQIFGRGEEGMSETRGRTTTSGTSTNRTTGPPNYGALASLLLPPSPMAGSNTGISTAGGVLDDLSNALLGVYGIRSAQVDPRGGMPMPELRTEMRYNPTTGQYEPTMVP